MKRVFRIPDADAVGVYMIENLETRRRYIGSTTNIKYRLKSHEYIIRSGYGINNRMHEDIEQGHNKFFAVALETFPDGTITNSQLSRIEREYTKQYCTENDYNFPGSSVRCRFGRKDPLLYAHKTLENLGMHKSRHKRENSNTA